MDDQQLKEALKKLIITESENEDQLNIEDFTDDEPLFGANSNLQLDSLDALQISVALQKEFGVRLQGDRAIRKHMQSINHLVAYINSQK